jgi:nicotinamide mononucleotide transporter
LQTLELFASGLGLINLWLTVRQNIWCWPVGIACVLCFAVVFFEARLYSDVMLQVVYTAVQLYGWWYWVKHGHQGPQSTLAVARLSAAQMTMWLLGIAVGALGLGAFMAAFTKADMAYLDAVPTALSMAAAWLQARKVLQSWWLFIVANILFISLYAFKGLYITIGLYVVSTAIALVGLRSWSSAVVSR